MRIESIEPLILNVTQKTNWFFIRITAENGLSGIGEASLNGWETAQLSVVEHLRLEFEGKKVGDVIPLLRVFQHSPGGLIVSSVISAIEQAVTDLRAKHAGLPIYAFMGKQVRKSLQIYANINRGARDRSPHGIAQAALNAVAAGYMAIKIAPFDGVYWGDADQSKVKKLTQLGIERIYAIREAVGPDVDIMVDCHWRFDQSGAVQLLREVKDASLYWIECPISENPDHFSAIKQLHKQVASSGMRLAGAEQQIGAGGFSPFIEDGLLDVVMPDVKYAGGYSEMLKIAENCARHDKSFAPHNPTGPVCNLASMHICSIAPAFLILEHQLDESPIFFEVVGGYKPKLVNGCFELPDVPGIGVTLDDDVLRQHPYRRLPANANLDPRLG